MVVKIESAVKKSLSINLSSPRNSTPQSATYETDDDGQSRLGALHPSNPKSLAETGHLEINWVLAHVQKIAFCRGLRPAM